MDGNFPNRGLVKIRIPNWAKFNPRSDRANYTWFRWNNDFLTDQRLFALSDSEIIFFQFCIAECSKNSADEAFVNLELYGALRRVPFETVNLYFQKLTSLGFILTADSRQDSPLRTDVPTDVRTNDIPADFEKSKKQKSDSDDSDEPPAGTPITVYVSPDAYTDQARAWIEFWEKYPVKKREDKARDLFHSKKVPFRDVLTALDNYLQDIAKGLVNRSYIMLPSTFVEGRFKEYLPPNWPEKIKLPKKIRALEPPVVPAIAPPSPEETEAARRELERLRSEGKLPSFLIKTVDGVINSAAESKQETRI